MHVQPSHKSRVTDCLLCASLLSFLLGVGRDEGRAASWPWHTNERAACVPRRMYYISSAMELWNDQMSCLHCMLCQPAPPQSFVSLEELELGLVMAAPCDHP